MGVFFSTRKATRTREEIFIDCTVYPSLNNNQDKLSPPPPLLLAGWYIESRAESKHIHLS